MTDPKAREMPDVIWADATSLNDNGMLNSFGEWIGGDEPSDPYNTKYIRTDTLPPQSPDQGAVEALDLLQKRAYSHAEKSNSPKLMREWIDSDVEVIRQALTRPNQRVDVAVLRLQLTDVLQEAFKDSKDSRDAFPAMKARDAIIDHLTAQFPHLFKE